MAYKVLIIIRNEWWSDGLALPTYRAAAKHRVAIAQRWNDCETAIKTPQGNVVAYQESVKFRAEISEMRTEERLAKRVSI